MKALVLVTIVSAAVALAVTSAEAAKKRKTTKEQATVAKSDPHLVKDYEGHVLGRDPDSFIRLMLIREGKIRDQHSQ